MSIATLERAGLRPDVAEVMDSDEAVLTGDQVRELVRWEASKIGMTYSAATRAAASGRLPAEADSLREYISLLGLRVR